MAQNKEVKSLLDSLVESYRIPKSSREYGKIKLTSARALSDKGLQRTNQFDVSARLDGLVEKLRILNNDRTADALQERLTELSALDTKWTPELLSLLLLLSDRPSKLLSGVDSGPVSPKTSQKEYDPGQIGDESSDEHDTELWKDIDFANDGSDEEYSVYSGSASTERSENDCESSHQETLDLNLAAFTVPVGKADLVSVNEACYWKQPRIEIPGRGDDSNDQYAQPLVFTELQAIRETLFMLLGLPTSGFRLDTAQDVLFTIGDEPAGSMQHLLQEFCSIGRELGILRAFIASQEDVPLMQTFQSALHFRIQQLDCHFDESQTSILDTNREHIASLIDLLTDTRRQASKLLLLTPVVQGLQLSTGAERCFSVLEGLYNLTCNAQSQADTTMYEHAADIFFQCFDVYLHPIRQWMEHGELFEYDQLLFIKKEPATTSPEDTWERQYALVKSDDGVLAAPKFLHVASTRIFNTGKSVNLLKKLGHFSAEEENWQDPQMALNFTNVCVAKDPYMLSPFAELFKSAFDQWVASKHRSSSAILRRHLADQCGLYRSLEALEILYCCKAGDLTSAALNPIFERLDLRQRRWNESAMITDLFRAFFRAADCIDVERIAVNCGRPKAGDRSMAVFDCFRLAFRLPWPIANIIRPAAMSVYSQTFILLAQLQRARFLLERPLFSSKGPPNPSLARHIKLSYRLRARLLHFTNSMLAHITSMVLDVQTREMKDLMAKAEDIDEMVAVHRTFIHKIENQSFLAPKHSSLKQAILSTLDLTVVLFDTTRAMRQDDGIRARSPLRAKGDDEVSSSDDEGGEAEQFPVVTKRGSVRNGESDSGAIYEKLTRISTRLTQLHSFIAAGVSSLSKSDTTLCWEILAANLNAGSKT